MNYVGIDIHKKYSVLCAQDEAGQKLKEGRIEGSGAGLVEFFEALEGLSKAVLEACWNWGLTQRSAGKRSKGSRIVVLAHPLKTRLIADAQIKTDRLDACAHWARSCVGTWWPARTSRDARPGHARTCCGNGSIGRACAPDAAQSHSRLARSAARDLESYRTAPISSARAWPGLPAPAGTARARWDALTRSPCTCTISSPSRCAPRRSGSRPRSLNLRPVTNNS